jgi:hypothetical protein
MSISKVTADTVAGLGAFASKQKVLGSPEYAKLSSAQQVKVIDYIEADVQQDKTQARADITFNQSQADRREAKAAQAIEKKYATKESMAAFYTAITDPQLKDKSRSEIYALAPTIGIKNVDKVLQEQEFLTKTGKPLALDKDILEAAKPTSLKKDSRTANNDAYDGFVKSALLDWQQLHPGKVPSVEDQKAIARSANTEYTVQGSLWGTNTVKAYEVQPNASTEAKTKKAIVSEAAAKGITLTAKQIENIYQKTLSK